MSRQSAGIPVVAWKCSHSTVCVLRVVQSVGNRTSGEEIVHQRRETQGPQDAGKPPERDSDYAASQASAASSVTAPLAKGRDLLLGDAACRRLGDQRGQRLAVAHARRVELQQWRRANRIFVEPREMDDQWRLLRAAGQRLQGEQQLQKLPR